MRLVELEPRWIRPDFLAFKCPHCKEVWLTCKRIQMSEGMQFDIYEQEFGENWNMVVVPCRSDYAWSIVGELENLTVHPSVDASASGHWHGWISNGEIK